MLSKWGRVAVEGTSMQPTLQPSDWLFVRWDRLPNSGQIVVARRPDRPSLLVVKRATRRADGWWLAGDNEAASDDSRVFGVVTDHDILGVVVARYWPRFGRL